MAIVCSGKAYRFLRRPNRQGVQNSRFPRADSEFHCHSGLVFEVSVVEKSAGKERKKCNFVYRYMNVVHM